MTRPLAVSAADMEAIGRHAERTYPEECCGFLLGSAPDPPDGEEGAVRVERVVPAANERGDSRHNRFVISPETVLAAHKEARTAGLDVVGYYHSHPDHPAEPSEFDREHAWPGLSYLIVSVRGGRVDSARSWRLRDDRERFVEEHLATAAPAGGSGGEAAGSGTAGGKDAAGETAGGETARGKAARGEAAGFAAAGGAPVRHAGGRRTGPGD